MILFQVLHTIRDTPPNPNGKYHQKILIDMSFYNSKSVRYCVLFIIGKGVFCIASICHNSCIYGIDSCLKHFEIKELLILRVLETL